MNNLLLLSTILIGIIYPIIAVSAFRKISERIEKDSAFRMRSYLQTMVISLVLLVIVFANLMTGTVAWPDVFHGFNTASVVFLILTIAYLFVQFRQKISEEDAGVIYRQMRDIWSSLPKSKDERHMYIIMSAASAIGEEAAYRFFLYHSLVALNIPSPAAILLLNLAFALTHTGSGLKNVISAFLLGIVFSVIYYFSGYLLLPIVLHAAIDIHAGTTGYRVLQLKGGSNGV